MEWTISVCIGPLWLVWSFWSVGLKCPISISQNCCPQNHSFVSCLQEQWANMQWLGSGLCNWNVHNCTVPLGTCNLRNFKLEFLLNGTSPMFSLKNPIRIDLCIDWKQKSLMGTAKGKMVNLQKKNNNIRVGASTLSCHRYLAVADSWILQLKVKTCRI